MGACAAGRVTPRWQQFRTPPRPYEVRGGTISHKGVGRHAPLPSAAMSCHTFDMDTRKLEVIQIRASAQFKGEVKAAAARAGMQMSAWIERALREAMAKPLNKR
jgi:hypothetical protein